MCGVRDHSSLYDNTNERIELSGDRGDRELSCLQSR